MRSRLIAGVLGGLFLAYAVYAFSRIGGPELEPFFFDGAHSVLLVSASAICLARGVLGRTERAAWAVLGLGMASWTAGELYWIAYLNELEDPPFPSISDAGYLGLYPAAYVALVLLARSRMPRAPSFLWLDGVIAALALAALAAHFVLPSVIDTTGGDPATVMTNLSYPLGDLILLSVVFVVFALTGWRPGRAWTVIGAGFAAFAVADVIFLHQTATGTFVDATPYDLTWPLPMLLLAYAAWQPPAAVSGSRFEGWRLMVLPTAFAAAAVGILLSGQFEPVGRAAVGLATLTLVAVLVRLVSTFAESQRMLRSTQHEALTDSLTGLRNHRAFMEDLGREAESARRLGQPLTLVMLDLDGLKRVNDSQGHAAGDEHLCGLAAALSAVKRGGDAVYRIGGDEFALILTAGRAWSAHQLLVRLRERLAAVPRDRRPSATAGVAEADGHGRDQLVRCADLALLEAKRTRQSVLSYSPGMVPEPRPADEEAEEHHRKSLATALARAVDAKDPYTRSHSETVSALCGLIAAELGLDPRRVAQLRLAGLLHDVGKVGIGEAILNKPSALSPGEWEVMRCHPVVGQNVLAGAELYEEALWVRHHHERFDGVGYPDGLVGEEVPLESRVILVADAFEAMTSDRPYRRARPDADALAELERGSGTQFDPSCVAALARVMSPSAARGRGLDTSGDGAGGGPTNGAPGAGVDGVPPRVSPAFRR